MVGEKMMLKNSDVALAVEALMRVGSLPLQPRAAYWLSRNWNQLLSVYNTIQKDRAEIIKKHGTLNEETNHFVVPATIDIDGEQKPNPKAELATDELAELAEREVEVMIHKLAISGFIGNLSLQDMNALSFMIVEEAEGSNLIQIPRPKAV